MSFYYLRDFAKFIHIQVEKSADSVTLSPKRIDVRGYVAMEQKY